MIHDRICPECGAKFSPRYGSQVCCSDECKRTRQRRQVRQRAAEKRKLRGIVASSRVCVVCGKEFLTTYPHKKTCSHECSVAHGRQASLEFNMSGGPEAKEDRRFKYHQLVERRKRDKARRIRLARRDALAPKPKTEIIYRNGIVIERRGTVPAGCHAAQFIRHNA